MLKVDQYQIIRRAHIVERKSIRQIAREYGHTRRTIRKILDHIVPPGYTRKQPVASPVMDPVSEWVDGILEADKHLPKKQRHTARRIYNRLVAEKEFKGNESTVRRYVRRWKRQHNQAEGFVRLDYSPGQDAQADFGQAQAIIDGREETIHFFVLRMCYSLRSAVIALPRETQECLFEGLRTAFDILGGVPQKIWFDNLSTAVSKVLKGRSREETDNFAAFRSHYLFEPVFCAPAKGNEKGHAENLVGYARRNFLVPIPSVSNFTELNEHLFIECAKDCEREVKGQTIAAAFEDERAKLLSLPHRPHSCRVHDTTQVNKFQEVTHDKFVYSVPLKYVHRDVRLSIGAFQIDIECDNKVIASHPRCYRPDDSGIDPLHYLDTLEYKPRAVEHARVLKKWHLPEVYGRLRRALKERQPGAKGDREYVQVLKLHREYDPEIIEIGIGLAFEYKAISAEIIRSLCHQLVTPTPVPQPVDISTHPTSVQDVHSWNPDLSSYDQLLRGGGR